MIHCHSGKDRTGLVAALVLRLARVAISDIAVDYAISAANLRTDSERWIAEAGDEIERARRTRICDTPVEAMEGVLYELERRYGSARGYLLAAGASNATIDRVNARLRV